MKKLFIAVLVCGLVFSLCGITLAATKAKTGPMSDLVRNQLAAQAKNTLEGRQWEVYVTSKGKKAVTESDIFTFAEGKVASQNLSAQGYKRSNLNVGIQDDGTVVWETMQVNADNDLAFFRGELHGNLMNGVISMQPLRGAKTVLDFSTAMPQAVMPAAAPQKKGGK